MITEMFFSNYTPEVKLFRGKRFNFGRVWFQNIKLTSRHLIFFCDFLVHKLRLIRLAYFQPLSLKTTIKGDPVLHHVLSKCFTNSQTPKTWFPWFLFGNDIKPCRL